MPSVRVHAVPSHADTPVPAVDVLHLESAHFAPPEAAEAEEEHDCRVDDCIMPGAGGAPCGVCESQELRDRQVGSSLPAFRDFRESDSVGRVGGYLMVVNCYAQAGAQDSDGVADCGWSVFFDEPIDPLFDVLARDCMRGEASEFRLHVHPAFALDCLEPAGFQRAAVALDGLLEELTDCPGRTMVQARYLRVEELLHFPRLRVVFEGESALVCAFPGDPLADAVPCAVLSVVGFSAHFYFLSLYKVYRSCLRLLAGMSARRPKMEPDV